MHKLLILLVITIATISAAHAQYYNTLPKGVRTLIFRNVQASNIESSFNHTNTETPYSFNIDASIEAIEGIDNQTVKDALDILNDYPAAYNAISLGTHRIEANADVKVDVYGFGIGITDRVSAYMGMPIYKANIALKYTQVKANTLGDVSEILQDEVSDNFAQALGGLFETLQDLDRTTIQSAIVNGLGYKELGDWNGSGLGDIELGVMYNFLNRYDYGLLLTTGVIAPTGRQDDPDIIQDVAFGDGQWDAFMELGGGIKINHLYTLNAWARYTHQFESEKKLRKPLNDDVSVSNESGYFTEKLGNKIEYNTSFEYYPTDWLKFEALYNFSRTAQATYTSDDLLANRRLGSNTKTYSENIRLTASLSTVKLFQKKKFVLPGQINFSIQKMVDGLNTPKYDRAEVELRLFF